MIWYWQILIVPTIYMLLLPFNFLGKFLLGFLHWPDYPWESPGGKKKLHENGPGGWSWLLHYKSKILPSTGPLEKISPTKTSPHNSKEIPKHRLLVKNILLKGTFQGYVGEILDCLNGMLVLIGMFCCGKYYAVIGRSRSHHCHSHSIQQVGLVHRDPNPSPWTQNSRQRFSGYQTFQTSTRRGVALGLLCFEFPFKNITSKKGWLQPM